MGIEDTNLNTDLDTEQHEEMDSEDQHQSQSQSAAATALETEARSHGWKPQSEYTKDDGKWVDAATFVERGKNFNSVLQRKVAEMEAKTAKAEQQLKALGKFHADAMKRKDEELATTIRTLRVQKSAATRDGEDEEAVALEDRIEVLAAERKALKEEPAAATVPETADAKQAATLSAWIEDGNSWFKDSSRLRAAAIAIGEELRAKGEDTHDRAFLNKVAAEMRKEFPEKFSTAAAAAGGNPLRNRPGNVEAGRGGADISSGHSERDLPAADRKLMREFVSQGLMTKEQFLKDYSWS